MALNELTPDQVVQIIALLTGRSGGQIFRGGQLTGETLDLLNNLVDQLGIHIAGDGKVTIDRDTTIGQAGVAGVAEVKDASDIVRAKLNPVGDSFVAGGNFGVGTKTPNTSIDNQGGLTTAGRDISTATGSLLITDHYINVPYTSTGAVTFNLLTAQSIDGRTINIYDSGNNASVNNITITTEGSQTIHKAASLVIVGNKDSATLRYRAANTDWELV